jgi:hypothetical protein
MSRSANCGYDTASYIQDVYESAYDEFRAHPAYWIRYFDPCPFGSFDDDPMAESKAAWDSGARSVGAVSSPWQSNLAGSTAQGQADAQTYCASLLSAYKAVGPLDLPSNQMLFCWLDQEASTSLSLDYWNGWATYVGDYNFADNRRYPLYPGLYCDPDAPPPNCSIIGNPDAFPCAGVWASTPEPCGTLTDPPAFAPEECPSVTTELWQFGEQGVCGYSANVDLNRARHAYGDYCFYLKSKP